MRDGAYWKPLSGGALGCELCPHGCRLQEGALGLCGIRRNDGGRLRLPYWGLASALALDPIEKKPLYHFLPGSQVLSVGFFGCNLSCPFCQNWRISKEHEGGSGGRVLEPGEVVAAALRAASPSLAFTYSEPSIHIEYLLETARLAREAGLATVLVTNGSLRAPAARDLLELMDAANVDLKSWSDAVYRDILKGDLATVKDFLALAAGLCHLEVTTLLVPGVSDDLSGIRSIAEFLGSLNPDTVLHLSAYHKDYHWDREAPSRDFLARAEEAARSQLAYVYLGNLPGENNSTLCPKCGAVLVERRGYRIGAEGLARGKKLRGNLAKALCRQCHTEVPLILGAGV